MKSVGPLKIVLLSVFLCCGLCKTSVAQTSESRPRVLQGAGSGQTDRTADEAARTALKVGDKMPSFALSDVEGDIISSNDLLQNGNLVVVFYRGAWCPYCNLYLQRLQKQIEQIQQAGATVVAISVESPDRSAGVMAKNKLQFTVLSDPNLETARKFGIVYVLPKETDEQYKSRGLDVAQNNRMQKAELPLSATYIVRRDGEIVFVYLEPDYKKRAEPDVLIEKLRLIRNERTN